VFKAEYQYGDQTKIIRKFYVIRTFMKKRQQLESSLPFFDEMKEV